MDGSHFDDLTRSFTESRRAIFGGALTLAVGWLGVTGVEAKKKRKRKRKNHKKVQPPTPNEFGCLEVGDLCTSEDDCCSGVCEGSKGKKTCRSHGTGTCYQDQVGYCLAEPDDAFIICNNSFNCFCYTTTAGSNFCGQGRSLNDEDPRCADCQTDADCLSLGYPAGSACAPVATGNCAGHCPTGMACLPPCGVELPESMN